MLFVQQPVSYSSGRTPILEKGYERRYGYSNHEAQSGNAVVMQIGERNIVYERRLVSGLSSLISGLVERAGVRPQSFP